MTLSVMEIAKVLKIAGKVEWRDKEIRGCAMDSGNVHPGNLFICLKGARADGHDFASAAQAGGAGAILASRPLPELEIPVLVVPDVVKALGKIANYWRSKSQAKIIAITGTSGKTTLKDMLVSILGLAGKTAGSHKNNNNQIGLPVSMLNMAGDEKFWVLEAGISHAGDMDELGAIIEPDIAVIINAGQGHTEGLAGEGVARNKAKLLKYLRQGGVAFVCGDYPDLLQESEFCQRQRRVFSSLGKADYYLAENDWMHGRFTLDHNAGSIHLKAPFYGSHFGELCGMAAACAHFLGLGETIINEGISRAQLPDGRFKTLESKGWLVFDDTYNANPLSMRAMLQSAAALAHAASKNLYVALGEMKELGKESAHAHRELGALLAALEPAGIFWKGGFFEEIKSGYVAAKGDKPFLELENPKLFSKLAKDFLPEKGAIIFKGSRSNRLEEYLSTFLKLLETSE